MTGPGWPPPESASPLQRRGSSRRWYTPTTQDFIRLLRWRALAGQVYAAVGERDPADILVRSMDAGEDRWVRRWTYPAEGLRAMKESGLLSMERVDAVPGFDPETLQRTAADRRRFGADPEFWRIELPSGDAARYPNVRPYRGPR